MTRRWKVGSKWRSAEGLTFRCVQGKKSPTDLRLEVCVGVGLWRPVSMSLGFMLADFFYENEDGLYPPPTFKGGGKYIEALRVASMLGHSAAQAFLETEQRHKQFASERR